MTEFLYVCAYFLIGNIVGGTAYAVAKRRADITPDLHLILGTLIWPLALIIYLAFGFAKVVDFIIYSKKDKIEAVTKRLKGEIV